jgi:hypothetical protein
MNHRKRWIEILIILLAIASWVLIFFPKQRVIGGLGGFYGPGKTAYREDYTCIGVKINIPPPLFTADGNTTYLCSGIIINRMCTMESVTTDDIITRTPVTCRD